MAEQAGQDQIKINGRPYAVPDDYTLAEARIIKRFTGSALDKVEFSDPDALAALIYIILRREDPSITEDVLDEIMFSGIEPVEPEADAGPPVVNGAVIPVTEETREVSGAPA